MNEELTKKAAAIRLLILDVDGVLSDGSLYYGRSGEELKMFNARDGTGIKWLLRAGVEVALLTGRRSHQVNARARDLGVKIVIQDAKQKLPGFERILDETKVPAEQTAFMGDDLLDLPVLRRVGLSMAPADAASEVREQAEWVSSRHGGRGAVREACELLLKAIGKWEEITAPYQE